MLSTELLWNSDVFKWGILPALIFLCRIADVSLGTIRIIFIARGHKNLAPLAGLFEIMIWLMAISQIMRNLDNFYYYAAYAAGFASGTYIGIWIENKIAIGTAIIRVIAPDAPSILLQELKTSGCGLTILNGQGLFQPVKIIFTIVKRKNIGRILDLIKKHNPQAVYTIEDLRFASPNTLFPVGNQLGPPC